MKLLLDGQESTRLKFRRLEISDFEEWLELFFDEATMPFLGLDEIRDPKERCELWFKLTFDRYENNQGGQNVLVDKHTNKIVGQAGLLARVIDGSHKVEIAYSILPQYRKLGYGSEAAAKCRDFAFANNLTRELISIIHVDNLASANVARSIGMERVYSGAFNGMDVDFYSISYRRWAEMLK